jgi:hypothetical protein
VRLDQLKLEHAPFAAAGRDAGTHFIILDDHPRFADLRTAYIPKPKATPRKPVESWGSKLWGELHRWALTADLSDVYAQLAWLYRWSLQLPAWGCECLPHWATLLGEDPPDFSSNEALFGWTVAVHNVVNRRLLKKSMGTADARQRWVA